MLRLNRRSNVCGSLGDGYFAVFFQLVETLFHSCQLFLDLNHTLGICAWTALGILREKFIADESESDDSDHQHQGNKQPRRRPRRRLCCRYKGLPVEIDSCHVM